MRLVAAIFCLSIGFCWATEVQEIVFIIISQGNEFHHKMAKELENSLREQLEYYSNRSGNSMKIFISQETFNVAADWTITPLIQPVLKMVPKNWVIVLQDCTRVSLPRLLQGLGKYDPKEEIWIGHQLHDSEASIIHHFLFHENPEFFKYPNLGSGFAISVPLMERLASGLEHVAKPLDFHIDPAHEFALFVYDHGKGPMMQDEAVFCDKIQPNCATYPGKFQPCGPADVESLFFAVKTCQQFHGDRVKRTQETWYRFAKERAFFSDVEDPSIPTVALRVPNTVQGHCQKTLAILQYTLKEFKKNLKLKWLVLVDDDTVLSVSRTSRLKTCFENDSLPIILGERYRFGAQRFDYPTGGAGILINRQALSILAQKCICPRADAPDDMVLGKCVQDFHIVFVHVPQMHQARPQDYAAGRLATKDAVTFHKHWMIDPTQVYQEWFLAEDRQLEVGSLKTEL